LVTGETAVTGFSRMWVGWSVVFALTMVLLHKDRDLLPALR
jgi:hypothetical protein